MKFYKIQTDSGIWEVKAPVGELGARHMEILMKAVPTSGLKRGAKSQAAIKELSPADMERFTAAFKEWSKTILPQILIKGPEKYEDMGGDDQFAIYIAMVSQLKIGEKGELFRFVK